MNKKAIAILGAIFILIVGTLGFLIYSKYSGSKNQPVPVSDISTSTTPSDTASSTGVTGDNTASTTQPSTAGGIIKLTDDKVVSPVLFYNGNGITYFDQSGALYQSAIDATTIPLKLTNKKQLQIPARPNIKKILWPRKGDNFIAEIVDLSNNKSWTFYNSLTGAFTDLPKQVFSLDWLPGGDKIYYVWSNQVGHDFLETADPDTKNFKKIGEIFDKNAVISVSPDGKNILYYPDSSASESNPIVLTTPEAKIWKALVKTGQNFGVLWSPDSQKFLFGKKDLTSQKYQLWYYNISTDEVKNIGLFTTVDKAVWDSDSQNIYSAVPTSVVPGSSAPTNDVFYKLNTSTLDKKTLSTGTGSADGEDLFLNNTSDKLFFRNAQDGGLYYIDLSQ